jgi:uncharacterized protein with FMN-binding domain
MRARTFKPIAALALTGVGTALVVGFRTAEPGLATSIGDVALAPQAAATTAPSTTSGGSGTTTTTPQAAATPAPTVAALPATSQTYADGTWMGDAIEEPWGVLQVEAVISGGQLTDVVLVSEPSDRHSRRINSQAVPFLAQEAVAAQGADIDLLGGATWTSESYVYSLQSALDSARAAVQTAG